MEDRPNLVNLELNGEGGGGGFLNVEKGDGSVDQVGCGVADFRVSPGIHRWRTGRTW